MFYHIATFVEFQEALSSDEEGDDNDMEGITFDEDDEDVAEDGFGAGRDEDAGLEDAEAEEAELEDASEEESGSEGSEEESEEEEEEEEESESEDDEEEETEFQKEVGFEHHLLLWFIVFEEDDIWVYVIANNFLCFLLVMNL